MAITWKLEGSLYKTTDTARKRSLYDLAETIWTEEEATYVIPVETGTDDLNICIPFDDAQMLAIFTDQPVSIQTVALGTHIPFSVCFIVMGSDIDELFVSNNSGNRATLKIFVGGEAFTGEPCA